MCFLVHAGDPAGYAVMAQALSNWAALTCSTLEVSPWPGDSDPAILFWDLDAGSPPDVLPNVRALFLCSCDAQAAIPSYALHPTGFLRKPLEMGALLAGLNRCRDLWWDSLRRLDILCDRLRLRLPLCDLVWAEGARRGCLIHSTREVILDRESLSTLGHRLPKNLFLRCQRSFLVNLAHIRGLDGDGLHMSDGAVIPLGRASQKATETAWSEFLAWRSGKCPAPAEGRGFCD